MKAIGQTKYGDETTLELVTVPLPKITKPHQLLIKVHVANISTGDQHINTLDLPWIMKALIQLIFGIGKPRAFIRGISGSGEIVSIGDQVTQFKVGQRVNFINSMKASVMAEYLVLNDNHIVAPFDSSISYEDAAPIAFGAMTALHFINEKTIKKGSKVLIYGASGAVGTYALQLASYFGGEVTAVASKRHYPLLSHLSVHTWIDYQDNPQLVDDKTYDVIFDAVGKVSKAIRFRLLKKNGTFLTVKSVTKEDPKRLEKLNQLIKNQHLFTIIDRVYPLNDYRQAHQYVYTGKKTGNVVLKITE